MASVSDVMNVLREKKRTKQLKRKDDSLESLESLSELAKSINPNNDVLYILYEELVANEELEMDIAAMITTMPEKMLLIESE